MHAPTFRNEINWTTAAAILGMIATICGGAYYYGQLNTRVDVLADQATLWREGHMTYHSERLVEVTAEKMRTDERLKALEANARIIDNLQYRMTVQEQGTTSLTAAVAELGQSVNDISGDIRLIREIVTSMRDRPPADGRSAPIN